MIIFAYNFEHNKTNDVIIECVNNGLKIELIIAQNKKKLNNAKLPFEYKKSEPAKLHPRALAKRHNIPYVVFDHNSVETVKLLSELKPMLGMVAGARIISEQVINKFSIGIINLHPGDLPEIRGMYSLVRAIKKGAKIMVTTHLIDHNIDAGQLIEKKEIKVSKSDTIFDISEKSYLAEISLIRSSVLKALEGKFTKLDISRSGYDYQIPFNSLEEFEQYFELYKERLT